MGTSSPVHPAPPHPFSFHSPVPVAHVTEIKHALTPVHPLHAQSSPLSHTPFVSFGSSSTATKEPSLVNTVQLRRPALDEKNTETDQSSLSNLIETRKPKAFESENSFKTSIANNIGLNVTPTPFSVPMLTTTEIITPSNTVDNEALVSFAQNTNMEQKSTSAIQTPTTASFSQIQTIVALTNIFSTPSPIDFSPIQSSNFKSTSESEEKKPFISFEQERETATPQTETSLQTMLPTNSFVSSVRPSNLATTRQPRVLQAVTPLVSIFASTPSPTILPNPTINLGLASNARENPPTAITSLNNPITASGLSVINLGISRPVFAQPPTTSQLRVPVVPQQNAILSIPVATKSQQTSQCQHPKGGGSYPCISFGVPHNPIFAFHTVQGDDGFFFGTGSGFPEHKIVNGPATIRRRRKLQKELIEKELARIKKEKKMRAKQVLKEYKPIYLSQKTNDKLPITSYQKKLLEKSVAEKIFKKSNKNKGRTVFINEAVTETIPTEPMDDNKIYQTNFVSDREMEMKSTKKSVFKTVTTPKVQLYEYPVEETILYTIPTELATATTIPSIFREQESKSMTETPRRLFPSSYESLNQNLIANQISKSYKP